MESIILKSKQIVQKNVPILVVWDSLAATSPLAELQGDYDQNTMGLQARVVSKGLRKITGVIGQNNVTLLILNQLREKIGVINGDPLVTPGGKATGFHASVRIRVGSGAPVKDKAGNIVGIHVTVSVKKNKVAAPFRKCELDIIFGKGIVEDEYIFDEVRSYCATSGPVLHDGKLINISGTGGWKELTVSDASTGVVLLEKKFYKSEFAGLMKDEAFGPIIAQAIDKAFVVVSGDAVSSDDDADPSMKDEVFEDV